jgi:phage-related protein
MKRVEFVGDSLAALRRFPESARKEAGVQLNKVQLGYDPSDWKPMVTSVLECVRSAFVTKWARSGCSVYVLHAFQKKTQQTAKRDIDLATSRLRQIH